MLIFCMQTRSRTIRKIRLNLSLVCFAFSQCLWMLLKKSFLSFSGSCKNDFSLFLRSVPRIVRTVSKRGKVTLLMGIIVTRFALSMA